MISGSGRSPGEGNGKPLQYSCLEIPMDREAWQATVHGISTVRHVLAASFRFNRQQLISSWIFIQWGFPGGSEVKASACNAGDLGSILGSGRSPGEGNGNPLQYSCLENPMDGGAWWATVHGVAKSRTRLSNFTFTFYCTITIHRCTGKKKIHTHSIIYILI